MDRDPEIPPGVETAAIRGSFGVVRGTDGVAKLFSHMGIRRDAGRLLKALGEVERDLQRTAPGEWSLALRSTWSVVAQRDGRSVGGVSTIPKGLDPKRLPPNALRPKELERTLNLDALDEVARATQSVLYRELKWPQCPSHPQSDVRPNGGVWVCQALDHRHHKLKPIGRLAPPPPPPPLKRKRLRADGTVEEIDD